MNKLWQGGRWLVPGLLAVTLVACATSRATSTPNYYLLEAPQLEAGSQQSSTLRLAVGPVVVADYLDQPALVIRQASHSLRLSEFERWATPLAQQIPQVLRSSFEQLLPGLHTQIFPSALASAYDYRVVVEVLRFDGAPSAEVELTANWQLVSGTGEALSGGAGSARLRAAVSGAAPADVVAAQASLLGELAEQIAVVLLSLSNKL